MVILHTHTLFFKKSTFGSAPPTAIVAQCPVRSYSSYNSMTGCRGVMMSSYNGTDGTICIFYFPHTGHIQDSSSGCVGCMGLSSLENKEHS